MSDNPYNAPLTQDLVTNDAKRFAGGTGTFTIGTAFAEAKRATFANLGVLIGVLIVCTVIAGISTATIIGYFLVLPVLLWGWTKVGLDAYDDQAAFDTLFVGFKSYGNVLGRMLMLVLLMILVSLPGSILAIVGMVMESQTMVMIGNLVSLAYTAVVSIRFSFAYSYAVEHNETATDAMRSSWNATRGLWLKLVGLAIVSSFIAFLGALALGVGLLVTAPLAMLMWISAYRQIAGRPVA